MRKIFGFEITTAIKDRPWSFQLLTLALLSFSLTIIFLNLVAVSPRAEKINQAYKTGGAATQASFESSASAPLLTGHQK